VAEKHDAHFFDLETASARAQLENPELALSSLRGLVVIDEIQRIPSLLATLRPLTDRLQIPARFLILGSVAPELSTNASESLAGRTGFVDMGGFDLSEVGNTGGAEAMAARGAPSFLPGGKRTGQPAVAGELHPDTDRAGHPQLGIRIPAETLRRFWMMIAHYHGQIWNGAELARSLAVSEHSVAGISTC